MSGFWEKFCSQGVKSAMKWGRGKWPVCQGFAIPILYVSYVPCCSVLPCSFCVTLLVIWGPSCVINHDPTQTIISIAPIRTGPSCTWLYVQLPLSPVSSFGLVLLWKVKSKSSLRAATFDSHPFSLSGTKHTAASITNTQQITLKNQSQSPENLTSYTHSSLTFMHVCGLIYVPLLGLSFPIFFREVATENLEGPKPTSCLMSLRSLEGPVLQGGRLQFEISLFI